MSRRIADSRAEFELLEACRFGGDFDRLRAVLRAQEFELETLKRALLTLEAGKSPTVRQDVTDKSRMALERRIESIDRRRTSL